VTSEAGDETPTMFSTDVTNSHHRLTLLFEISRFPSHYGMMSLEVSTMGPQIGENWDLSLLKFLVSTYEHPFRSQNISEQTASCDKVSPQLAQGRRKICGGKKEITRPKYNSLPLSLERCAGDCNYSDVTSSYV